MVAINPIHLLSRRIALLLCAVCLPVRSCPRAQTDPLPSWNDGAAKQAIMAFVTETTTAGRPGFVPEAERIVTFDQDGTLWVEKPMYSQVIYCLDRVPAVVKAKPELAECRTVQDRDVGRSRGDGPAVDGRSREDPRRHADRHDGRGIQGGSHEVARQRPRPALEASLYGAHLPADAGGGALLPRQRLQNLHRNRRRPGLRARLRRARLRHPARAGRRHRRRHDAMATTRTASRSSSRNRSSC